MEEISHEQIGCPGFLQLGETVKYIERIPPLFLDQLVDPDREGFKQMG